jgi:hypothetical protein
MESHEEQGKLIQEHLENVNMEPWSKMYLFKVFVNPLKEIQKKIK